MDSNYIWKDRKHVEAAKDKRRMRTMEVMGGNDKLDVHDPDGDLDDDICGEE